jgi:hypothetical protein
LAQDTGRDVHRKEARGHRHIEISRHVTFDEEAALKKSRRCQLDEVYEEEPENPRIAEYVRKVPRAAEPVREVVISPDEETPEDHDIIEVQEPPQMTFSHKRKPAWARDLIQNGEKYGVPEGTTRQVKRPKPFSSYTALMCNLLDEEPTCFEEAIQKKEWADAMTEEYQSIMKNEVWEIVPRSKNKDGVSYRWLFKIKHAIYKKVIMIKYDTYHDTSDQLPHGARVLSDASPGQ